MPTKSEAAEALYRAVERYHDSWKGPGREDLGDLGGMFSALLAYETATPDAVPPEVQRVVEAACWWRSGDRDVAAVRALSDAVDAYRSSQPEPLSARLARLGKGARVRVWHGATGTVEANALQHERLWLAVDGNESYPMSTYRYDEVTAILSESP